MGGLFVPARSTALGVGGQLHGSTRVSETIASMQSRLIGS